MTRSTGSLVLAGCNLAVAGLQLLFFLPVVEGGRALDVALWSGGPLLLRVDRLSLLFGVVWAVALALAALAIEGNDKRWAWLVTLGLLGAAYAREPVLFYMGWEVAGLGVWLSAPVGEGSRAKLAALVHGPGLALLALIVMGGAGAFVPPEGGKGQEWTLAAVLLMAVAAGGRSIAPVLYLWLRTHDKTTDDGRQTTVVHDSASYSVSLSTASTDAPGRGWLMLAVFGSTGPFLLAKALVEARWDDWGVWALTLVGTAGLLAVAAVAWKGATWPMPLSSAVAAVAIIGLGVAPVSPVAAMGAVLLVGLGAFLPLLSALGENEQWWGWVMGAAVAASAAGTWMVVQGALGSRYAVTAIVVLPALVLIAGYSGVNRAGIWAGGAPRGFGCRTGEFRCDGCLSAGGGGVVCATGSGGHGGGSGRFERACDGVGAGACGKRTGRIADGSFACDGHRGGGICGVGGTLLAQEFAGRRL